ncbi:MAG: TatD family hydrolase [Gelidibacter sp.]
MTVTDTHTHLYSEAFNEDRKAMIERAITANVTRFFIPAIDSSYTKAMLQLEADFPNHVHLMTGLHPTSVKNDYKEELRHVEELLSKRKFVAIGEIGIDLYWDKSTLEIQQEAFRYQIRLAKQYQLPIVIHCREAFDEIFEVLETEKSEDLFGIFHCFTGDLEQAKRAVSFNMKLGIGGVVTFKNGGIDKFLNQIDLEHIVLETDSPYLAPAPYRGKRNESAYIIKVLEKLSELYGLSQEEVATITTENSKAIFKV